LEHSGKEVSHVCPSETLVLVPGNRGGSDAHGHGPGKWAANQPSSIPFVLGPVERFRPLVQPVQPIRLPTHSLCTPCLALPKRQPFGAESVPFDKFKSVAGAFAESDIGQQPKPQPVGAACVPFGEFEPVAGAFAESDIGQQPKPQPVGAESVPFDKFEPVAFAESDIDQQPRPSDSPITISQLDGQCDPFNQGALSCRQHRNLAQNPSIERHPLQRFGTLPTDHAANHHVAVVGPTVYHDLTDPRQQVCAIDRLNPYATGSLQHDTYDRDLVRSAVV